MNPAPNNNDLRSRYRHRTSEPLECVPPQQQTQVRVRARSAVMPSGIFASASHGYEVSSRTAGLQSSRTDIAARESQSQTSKRAVEDAGLEVAPIPRSSHVNSRKSKRLKSKKPKAALYGVASFAVVLGVAMGAVGWKGETHVEAQAVQVQSQPTATAVDAGMDETVVSQDAIEGYTVLADHPKKITIPKIKTNARVLGIGLKNGNQLDTPENIFDTGWYDKSAKPGSGGGAVLIDGYVSGRHKEGVFYNLKTLVAGDQITVERGDGQVVVYEVVKLQNYPYDNVDMTAAMLPVENGKEGLNIVTSHGDLNNSDYQERLVVFAVRVS